VMTSRANGQGRPEITGAVLRRGLSYSLWIGLVSTFVLIAGGPAFLHILGLEKDLADGASKPLIIFALSMPGYAFSVAASFWLEGQGRPKPAAVMMWLANGVNLALDLLLVPVGGGGLIGGTAIAAAGAAPHARVLGAEPEGAADAFESLRRGVRVTDMVADTVCDGLRGIVGPVNLQLLRAHDVDVLLVSDAETLAAMRLLWERLKLLVEPSSATVLAAVLRYPERFAGRRVGIILSGGNVDLDARFGARA